MSDTRDRIDELVDIDPLALRDLAFELLGRAETAEDRLRQIAGAVDRASSRADEAERTRAEQAEAAVRRVRELITAYDVKGIQDGNDGLTLAMRHLAKELDPPAKEGQ